MLPYEREELKKICERMGGKFEGDKCIVDHVNDDLRSHFNYHGWNNYETWIMNLYLTNEESWQETMKNIGEECRKEVELERLKSGMVAGGPSYRQEIAICIGNRIKDIIEGNKPSIEEPYSSLLTSALDEVNWTELGDAIITEGAFSAESKARKIYSELSESERAGLRFGLFPARIQEDIKDRKVMLKLMDLAQEEFGKL